jgi:phosphate:Na+ symporter
MYQHRRKIFLVLLSSAMVAFCHAAGELSTGFSTGPWILAFSSMIGGLGLFLMGMKMMSDSLTKWTGDQIRDLLARLTQNRFVAFLIGIFATMVFQSSSAFIGILIVMAGQGLLSLDASVPLMIGANIGTAITAIIASSGGSRESKQVALAHTFFKVIGALIIVWFIPWFVRLIVLISPPEVLARQITNAHTVFNTLIALVLLPFSGIYARLINRMLPVREEKHASLTTWYVDESLLNTPSMALGVARQEVLRMMEIAERMTEEIIVPFMEKRADVLVKIRNREQELNFLRDAVNAYLIKIIRQDITSGQAEEAYQMMYAVDEFEQIGDIISVTLHDKAESWCRSDYHFSSQGREEILDFHLKTLKILYQTYRTFGEADLKGARKGAKKSKEKYSDYRTLFFDLEKQHYERLKKEVEESIETSRTHMEIIASLKVIGSHATNIARILLKEEKNGGESAHRRKLEGHSGG